LPSYEGLFCAVGFSGHGFKLAPSIGAFMATLVLSGEKPTDMQPFNVARFANGEEIRPSYAGSGVLG